MARARSAKRGGENATASTSKTSRGRSRRSGSNEVLQEQDVNSPVRLKRDREYKHAAPDDTKVTQAVPHERVKKRKAATLTPPEQSKRKKSAIMAKPSRSVTSCTSGVGTATVSRPQLTSAVTIHGKPTDLNGVKRRLRSSSNESSDVESTIARRHQPSRMAKAELISLNQFHLETAALTAAKIEAATMLKRAKPKDADSTPLLRNGAAEKSVGSSSSASSTASQRSASVCRSTNSSLSRERHLSRTANQSPEAADVAAAVLKEPSRLPVAVTASVPEPWMNMPYQGTFVNFSRRCRISNPRRSLCELMESCRKQKLTLELEQDNVYIVEKIVGHESVNKDQMRFLVRWKDWSPKYDTWEPEPNLVLSSANCLLIVEYFDRKKESKLSHQYLVKYLKATVLQDDPADLLLLATLAGYTLDPEHGPPVPFRKIRRQMQQRIRLNLAFDNQRSLLQHFGGKLSKFMAFAKKRACGLDENQRWESLIAMLEPNAEIAIENVFDAESLPSEFKYVTDYVVSPNVRYEAPSRSCKCKEGGCFGKECCGVHAGRYRGYIRGQLARTCGQVPLYECNRLCRCGPKCENRLIQKGVQLPLTIFKTMSRGWGVRAEQKIARGTFIAEYLGELMTSAEAVSRHSVNFSYLFDLQPYRDRPVENTVDAAIYGNVSRFFNHSCDPNIAISYAYIENHNPAAPRLAFFARRDIARYEELTFNYCMQTTGTVGTLTKVECKCGSPKCRKFLF
ncbi:histone-lysine N-methyltransferase SUV39H2-like [Tropilaelaps mercedesae]|uniref:Histone-lysine N-methyltransferase SUV39H2-like n=1 Tax=Tropilaelaps mercedesae TaxID=418985 RepID=A0A1V9XEH3_9ACAR|nr:histone-lysine N-methyltransferase SUV39H2-like [Tropilaelaps mercedesae]